MNQTRTARVPLKSWEQNLFPAPGPSADKPAWYQAKATTPLNHQPLHASVVDEAAIEHQLANVLRTVPCAWPGCPAVLNSLRNYARHLEKCHALPSKSTTLLQPSALRASGGYHCKLRPCTNQAHPNAVELSRHLEALHVVPLYRTCPHKDCGTACDSLTGVLQHLATVHRTTPERLGSALPRPASDRHDEPPELPRYILPIWTLTTPRIRKYHKDIWVPPPPRPASPEPPTPPPSSQSSSEAELPPRRGVDFPHSFDYVVYEPLELTPAPCVGTSFDSDAPPPPGQRVCEVRRVVEPATRQLSGPLSTSFVPPPPREPTRSIYAAFRAKFERARPGELDDADADGDPDDFDGDGAETDWSFDGVTDDEAEDDDPTPRTSRESTAAARRPGKRRKKRW